jgi:putative ABC transport system substrate-binding protein
MLKEIAPTARRVGVIYDNRDASPREAFAKAQEAATRLGVHLVELRVDALRADPHLMIRPGKIDGIVLIPGGAISSVAQASLEFASTMRIPSVTWTRDEATHAAILSYGVNDVDVARDAARMVARVLNGQRAGDLPIERPNKLELTINMTAARALGIAIPQSIHVRADRVIE